MKVSYSLHYDFLQSGFAELQTDMTDLTKELNRSQGIPFLEYKYFVTRTFFPKVRQSSILLLFMYRSYMPLYLAHSE